MRLESIDDVSMATHEVGDDRFEGELLDILLEVSWRAYFRRWDKHISSIGWDVWGEGNGSKGMLKEIENLFTKKIRSFMAKGKRVPMISLPILHGKIRDGGKKLLDVVAQNQAIELMKVKSYLVLDNRWPRWAYVADVLISKKVTAACHVNDELSKSSLFLQSWRVNKTKGKTSLPESLWTMIRIADEFCVAFNPRVLNVTLKQELPMWHHIGLDNERIRNNGQREACMHKTH